MMSRYKTSKQFDRHFKKRISPHKILVEDYRESLNAFLQNPTSVKDHRLSEIMQNERAFWINEEYRVVYRVQNNQILLIDIGTHEQVYKRRTKKS